MSTSQNPILVEVWRGDAIESIHRGAVIVVNSSGEIVFALGDVERLIFPRSAAKMIQALPLLETGAAEHFKLTDEEIALACASHAGEPGHVIAVERWLTRLGLSVTALQCGTHEPTDTAAMHELAATRQKPTALHNNCSGKHAGFLTTALHLGVDPRNYVRRSHPIQQGVSMALSEMAEFNLQHAPCGIDGCGIPTHAIPLRALANAMCKMASPCALGQARRSAVDRILGAMRRNPWLVGGSGRFDTLAMQAGNGGLVVKMGAEGVHVAIAPGAGLGIALKIDDGARRAAEMAMAKILTGLGLVSSDANRLADSTQQNNRGETVGELCVGFGL